MAHLLELSYYAAEGSNLCYLKQAKLNCQLEDERYKPISHIRGQVRLSALHAVSTPYNFR